MLLDQIVSSTARNALVLSLGRIDFFSISDYARATSVDWGQMENVQKGFVDRYLAEVR